MPNDNPAVFTAYSDHFLVLVIRGHHLEMLTRVSFKLHRLRTILDGEEAHAGVVGGDQELGVVKEGYTPNFTTGAEPPVFVAAVDP